MNQEKQKKLTLKRQLNKLVLMILSLDSFHEKQISFSWMCKKFRGSY